MTEEADLDTANLTCFVIGPIGNRHASHGSDDRVVYEEALKVMAEVIEPACGVVGLTPVRADNLARAGEITEQIFRRLRDDHVVIADLTGANANVMYELGLRHTQNRLTVQLGEYGRLPFDVNVIRTIRFSRSDVGLINARDELIEILEAGLAGDFDPVTATRVWCEEGELREDPEEPPSTDGVGTAGFQPDAEGEDGFLDVMVEAEERQEELAPALEAVGARIIELGGLAESATNEMSKSDAAGKGMRGRLQIATKYADGVDRLATELDAEVDRYAAVLSSVSAGNLALIAALEEDPAALDDPAAREFGMTLRGVARISRESLGDLDGLVASINDNARLSRVLKEPTNRLTAALQRFVSVTSTIDEWDRRLQSLGIPMPPEDWEPQDEAGEEAVSAGDEESAPDPQGAPHPGGDDAPEPDPRGEAHRDDGEPGSSEKTD